MISEEALKEIRERDARDMLALPQLEALHVLVRDPELLNAIHMLKDRNALLKALDELRNGGEKKSLN